MATPLETAIADQLQPTAAVTQAADPEITEAARLHCTDGSTILHTTDCTMGTPVSYCFKEEPQSSAMMASSLQSGIQIIAWNNRPASHSTQCGSRRNVRMERFRTRRRHFMMERLLEGRRL